MSKEGTSQNKGGNSAPPHRGGRGGPPPRHHDPRVPRGPPTCFNCGNVGHIARNCTSPRAEGETRQQIEKRRFQFRRCFNCGKMGHISAICSMPAGNKACYICGKEGHIARECPSTAVVE